jgi:hypothetical protein
MGRVRSCAGGINERLCYVPRRSPELRFELRELDEPRDAVRDGELGEVPQEIGHNIRVETFKGTEGALIEGIFEGRLNGFKITINGR